MIGLSRWGPAEAPGGVSRAGPRKIVVSRLHLWQTAAMPDAEYTRTTAELLAALDKAVEEAKPPLANEQHRKGEHLVLMVANAGPPVLDAVRAAVHLSVEAAESSRAAAAEQAATAGLQARRLTLATWVLAGATIALALATVALVYVTAGG